MKTKIAGFFLGLFASATLLAQTNTLNNTQNVIYAYPKTVSQRPFVLPQGVYSVNVNYGGNYRSPKMGVSATMGLLDWLQAGVSYSDALAFPDYSDVKISRTVELNIGMDLYANSFMGSMLQVGIPLHFGESHVLSNFEIGLPVAFGLGKGFGISFLADNFMEITLRPDAAVAFNIPMGLSYQLSDAIWTKLSTNLMHIPTSSNKNTYIYEKTPIKLSAVYALSSKMDVSANIGFEDALKASDSFALGLGFSFRGGII